MGNAVEGGTGPGVLVNSLLTLVVTGAWYAMPDVVRSRPLRTVLKLGIVAGSVAYGVAAGRVADGPSGDAGADPAPADGADALTRVRALTDRSVAFDAAALGLPGSAQTSGRGDLRRQAVGLGVGAAAVGLTVAGERGIHRYGERLAARGVRAPHTRVGAVIGLLTAAGTFFGERWLTADDARS